MLKSLSPRAKRNILRILPFGLIWLVFSQIFLISDYTAVGNFNDVPDTAIKMDLGIYIFATLTIVLLGLSVGAIELVYLNNRFARRSLTQKIVYKSLAYSGLLFLVTVVSFLIAAAMEVNTHVLDVQVWNRLFDFLSSMTFLSTVVQLSTMLGVSLFYAEISEHMGHRVLINFFRGKYHKPKEEVRIFMFSDMKSSTQIAEQIGHVRYFELLQAYYDDLSNGIVTYAGEIYQYVGDEVVVSWPLEDGLENQNCIRCFFKMKEDLRQKAGWYEQRFGVVPDFKAGFHVGPVTTGEIGALKKDIVFSGDVLNATARIQGLCNKYGVELLISADLLACLLNEIDYEVKPLGKCKLRGKEEVVELFTLIPPNRY